MGPKAFHKKSLIKIFKGTGLIVLHCAAPLPEHYEEAVGAAIVTGRSVIIESQPTHEKEWFAFIVKHAPTASLIFISPNAPRHPQQAGSA
jgi:hypothetical protein